MLADRFVDAIEDDSQVARLVIQDGADTSRRCDMTSPGVDWLLIDTDCGFAHGILREMLDDEVLEMLHLLVAISAANFRGDGEVVTVGRLFSRSVLRVHLASGVLSMQRTLIDDVRQMLRRA